MNKAIHTKIITPVFLIVGIFIPMLSFASISPSDLANTNFTNKCSYTSSNDLDDLNHILQYNLCSEELTDSADIAQCARIALTQYTVCRYFSILDNSTTSITASSSSGSNNTSSNDDTSGGYNSNTTNSSTAPKRRAFNWF